jgi:sulfur-oxidizing protein SoxZ
MAELNARVKVPPTAKRGGVIEIRCTIMHPMETGYNFDSQGTILPIHLINTFVCRYNGDEVFRANLGTGISANPYLTFFTVATESGTIEFAWHDDDGSVTTARAQIEVE